MADKYQYKEFCQIFLKVYNRKIPLSFVILLLLSVETVSIVQVVDILVLSDLHKAVELKATAISFLLAHKEEVFSQPDWKIKLKVGCLSTFHCEENLSLRAILTCCWKFWSLQ